MSASGSARPRLISIRLLMLMGIALLLFPGVEIYRVTLGTNWHAIDGGSLFRSGQLNAPELRAAAHRYGIKTIVNLRSANPQEEWYQDEKEVAQTHGIEHHDLTFSAYLTPAPQELLKLMAVLEKSPRPILIHCRQGADRTGLASALAALYEDQEPAESARKRLSMRCGHVGLGRVESMQRVIDDYFSWLEKKQQSHSRRTLLDWISKEYRPGRCWAKIEPMQVPETVPLGQPWSVRVRVHNLSHTPWEFRSDANVGMHLRGYIEPEGAKPPPDAPPFTDPLERKKLSAGFFNVTVVPGGHVDLEVPLPVLQDMVRYRLCLDIYDENARCFGAVVGSPRYTKLMEAQRAGMAQK